MAVVSQDWYDAQCCILGAALMDPELVPLVVSELQPEHFAGGPRKIFQAMRELFGKGSQNGDVDALAIVHHLGDSKELRDLIMQLMQSAVMPNQIQRYLTIVRESSGLLRLQELGHALDTSSSYAEAGRIAEEVAESLVAPQKAKAYSPDDLIDEFEEDLSAPADYLPWPFSGMESEVFVSPGNYVLILAEPSGGKTALALQLMLLWAREKRVLFLSQETDERELFLRMAACMAGVSLKQLLLRKLSIAELKAVRDQYADLRKRQFKVVPTSGLTVSQVKAAAIAHRAEIVIIDYLQILKGEGTSRVEVVGEISRQLQAMAKGTGMVVVALSQVTIRDPSLRNKPLDMHSARESGQIEQDADLMLALDKFVEKEIRADRVLRVVKNKRGQWLRIPLQFDGRHQRFTKIELRPPELEKLEAAGRRNKKTPVLKTSTTEDFEQLPMDTEVPAEFTSER